MAYIVKLLEKVPTIAAFEDHSPLAFASCVARVPRYCVQFVSVTGLDGLANDQLNY